MSVSRQEWVQELATLLNATRFKDYCPNGLQVEGRATVQHLVTGVTASEALIEAALADGSLIAGRFNDRLLGNAIQSARRLIENQE